MRNLGYLTNTRWVEGGVFQTRGRRLGYPIASININQTDRGGQVGESDCRGESKTSLKRRWAGWLGFIRHGMQWHNCKLTCLMIGSRSWIASKCPTVRRILPIDVLIETAGVVLARFECWDADARMGWLAAVHGT
jgi:hypothetical protein